MDGGGADIPPALAGPDEALAAFKCELGFSPPVPLTPPGWGGPAADWLFGAPIESAGASIGWGGGVFWAAAAARGWGVLLRSARLPPFGFAGDPDDRGSPQVVARPAPPPSVERGARS